MGRLRLISLSVLALAGCGGSSVAVDAQDQPPIDAAPIDAAPDLFPPASCTGQFPNITLERVGTDTFTNGTFVGAARGDADRLYVVQQDGLIRVIRAGQATTFLDLSAGTESSQENGAFALAFHPNYVQNGRFWVSRTPMRNGVVTVEEYRRSAGNPDVADATPVRVLAQSAAGDGGSHNGGAIAFGPDGRLYLSVGDGRSGDSDDPAFLRGKIFRLDVDAPGTTTIDLSTAIWSRGLRNPWRFSFDRANGDIYIGDVGGSTEEINIEPGGGPGGRNYGWPTVDGNTCAAAGCDMTGVTLPATRANGGVVVGGYVYRGPAIPCLRGWYVYTDFAVGVFSRLHGVDGAATDHAEIPGLDPHPMVNQPSSMGEDAAGELYVVNHTTGALFRIIAAP